MTSLKLQVHRVQDAVDRLLEDQGEYWRPASAADHLRRHLAGAGGDRKRELTEAVVAALAIALRYRVSLQQAFMDAGIKTELAELSVWGTGGTDAAREPAEEVARIDAFYTSSDYASPEPDVAAPAVPLLEQTLPQLLLAVFAGFDTAEDFRSHFQAHLRDRRGGPVAERPFHPSRAESVRAFEPIQQKTYCPFAQKSRLWGAPTYAPELSLEENLRASLPSLLSFIKVTTRDGLDGFVYAFPTSVVGNTLPELSRLFRDFFEFLATHTADGMPSRETLLDPKWRLFVHGEQAFISVFAPFYPHDHSRFTYEARDWVFMMIQPETAIHHLIPDEVFDARALGIRQRFGEAFQPYQLADVEADRFLLPMRDGDPRVPWYDLEPSPAG